MIPSKIYYRTFPRTDQPDYDTEVTPEFMKEHFTDFFGGWLQRDDNAGIFTFDEILLKFYGNPTDFKLQIYAVSDASHIENPEKEWFNNHLRFLAIVTPNRKQPFDDWTLFIVGSKYLKEPDGFLQVASWDNSTGINEFRFYEKVNVQPAVGEATKDNYGWTYNGRSSDAFNPSTEYLGPFNGHVNGSVIMKEIRKPWYHWKSGLTAEFDACLSTEERKWFSAENAPYLTESSIFSRVTEGSTLEPIIDTGLSKWYGQRVKNAFQIKNKPHTNPVPIKRWMAHILLTTTINIATSTEDPNDHGNTWFIPDNHFLNAELLDRAQMNLVPETPPRSTLTFSQENYDKARVELQMKLMQEYYPEETPSIPGYYTFKTNFGTLGGGKQTGMHSHIDFVAVKDGEGFPFAVLQPSIEDAQATVNLTMVVTYPKKIALLSEHVLNSLLFLDFWNPVYSWRRGILMDYVPETTTYDETTKTYDFEDVFLRNIRNSSFAKDSSSPEAQLINLIDNYDLVRMQARIKKYLVDVQKRLKTPEGVLDYMKLAECRRRIYRPLPLDEFGYTLPYALNYQVTGLIEMGEDATIQNVPVRGSTWMDNWIKTLWGYDPILIPVSTSASRSTATEATAMNLAPQCPAAQTKGKRANVGSKAAGCAFARTRGVASSTFSGSVQSFICTNPTWDDQISKLFSAPYWLEEPERSKVGQSWIRAMKHWGVDLDLEKYDDVKQKATSIYRHMISRSMPLTDDPNHYFPDDAIETYRLWVNQGCRKSLHDITVPGDVIPVPEESKVALRIRKDLRNLTPQELQTYRAQLDDVLGTGRLHSKWQELGLLHAEWCLHYQEATFPWHRAYLRYVEELIDCPIPYWNGFAVDTSDPESPYAGLPKEFLEETYIHPDGTTRPNPMKYALSLNGQSKAGGEFTTRYKVLEDGPSSPDWVGKINLFKKYHEQVKAAMEKPTFSVPMSYKSPFGLPWANLPAFTDDQADDLYPLRELNFDGAFEQPHDNYHGWVGPDMADNAYTGFDPVFLSMHANLDRLFEVYVRAHPEQTYTANFPLRPFTTLGSTIDYSESREFMYATIGDMTKATQALGYMYAPPAAADFLDLRTMRQQIQKTACPMSYKAQPGSPEVKTPYVLFTDVKCTKESYQIDVFTPKAASLSPDPVENPDFIGRLTLLAMGPEEVVNGKQCAKDRCGAPQQRTVRILEANCVRDALENAGEKELIQVVTDLQTGEVVAESQWRQWPGFVGKLMWGTKRM